MVFYFYFYFSVKHYVLLGFHLKFSLIVEKIEKKKSKIKFVAFCVFFPLNAIELFSKLCKLIFTYTN